MSILINYLVSCSNIYGFLPLFYSYAGTNKPSYGTLLIANAILASTLMHISETKHGLTGVPYLNMFSQLFLNYDRLSAVTLVIHTLVTTDFDKLVWLIRTVYPYLALLALFLSENVLVYNVYFFAVTHSCWHILAFHCLYLLQ
jgi:hypothetical protein